MRVIVACRVDGLALLTDCRGMAGVMCVDDVVSTSFDAAGVCRLSVAQFISRRPPVSHSPALRSSPVSLLATVYCDARCAVTAADTNSGAFTAVQRISVLAVNTEVSSVALSRSLTRRRILSFSRRR